MSGADWAILVPAVVGCLGSLGAYLHSRTVKAMVKKNAIQKTG